MRRPHSHFQCAEGVLDRLAPRAHRIRIAIEPLLRLLKHVLVLPTRYAPLLACRAFGLERAAAAGIRPIAAESLSVLLFRVVIFEFLAGRAAIDIAKAAKEVLQVEELEAVADRGYFNGEEIKECDDAGITVTLPKPQTSGAKAEGRLGEPLNGRVLHV